MEFETVAPYLFFVVGVIGRVVIPYVKARIDSSEPLSFDWRYLVGQLIGAAVALVPLVAGDEFLSQIGSLSWLGAILYGWGSGDVGRTLQKVVSK